jgi:hypothetical protein
LKSIYSRDGNLWHLSHEGGPLEDTWLEPEEEMFQLSVNPEEAPDQAEYVEIEFDSGTPVAVNGVMMSPGELVAHLVGKGVSFREAHRGVAEAVRQAAGQGQSLESLDIGELQAIHPAFEPDFQQVFDPMRSLSRRSSVGGTAPGAVRAQLDQAKEILGSWSFTG